MYVGLDNFEIRGSNMSRLHYECFADTEAATRLSTKGDHPFAVELRHGQQVNGGTPHITGPWFCVRADERRGFEGLYMGAGDLSATHMQDIALALQDGEVWIVGNTKTSGCIAIVMPETIERTATAVVVPGCIYLLSDRIPEGMRRTAEMRVVDRSQICPIIAQQLAPAA